jgi:hypothetical protein
VGQVDPSASVALAEGNRAPVGDLVITCRCGASVMLPAADGDADLGLGCAVTA